jgi:predicted amidohydrolase YtcJ
MAELIVHNAHVITQDHHQPGAEAFAVDNGKIIAVGSKETILSLKQAILSWLMRKAIQYFRVL